MGTASNDPKIIEVGQTTYVPYRNSICTPDNELDPRTAPYRLITVRVEMGVEFADGTTHIATPDVVVCTRKRGLESMAEAVGAIEKALRNRTTVPAYTIRMWKLESRNEVKKEYVHVMLTRMAVLHKDIISMKVVEVGDIVPPEQAEETHARIYWHAHEREEGYADKAEGRA